jgi:hypothetical protein
VPEDLKRFMWTGFREEGSNSTSPGKGLMLGTDNEEDRCFSVSSVDRFPQAL